MTKTLINITRTSIEDICKWEHIDTDKIEYCQETTTEFDWVNELTGYIYTFEVWNNDSLIHWLQDEPVSEVFYGYLYDIIAYMKDEDSIITLWDINFVDIYDWEGIPDCKLVVKYLGEIDMDKLELLVKEK